MSDQRSDGDRHAKNGISRNWPMIGLSVLFILVVLLFLWYATDIFGVLRNGQVSANDSSERSPILQGADIIPTPTSSADPNNIPVLGVPPGPPPVVSARFHGFYESRGGLRIFGFPISAPMEVNGREVQWFERARLEHWPEYAGTPYEVQPGRLGVEYTQGREFPTQTFFASRPGLRYFAETSHGLGEPFLRFWEQNGGLEIFGFPISEEFNELLGDGRVYRVQYFERVRLEQHPEHAGTPYEVQIGLLGRALYLNNSRPDSIPLSPTTMPLQ